MEGPLMEGLLKEGLLMEGLLMEGLLMDIDDAGTTSTTDLFRCVFKMYPSFHFVFSVF